MNDSGHANIAAVILAAGEGLRFGGPKALAKLGGKTFLEIIVRNLREVASDTVVIGGSEYEKIETESKRLDVRAVFNPKWPMGQFTSLKIGLRALVDETAAVIAALVDHPLVKPETYRMLCDQFKISPDKILIPVIGSRRGHPLLIPAKLRGVILNAPDQSSLRDILKSHSSDIFEVPVTDIGILRDIDTRQDLEEALRAWA